MRLVSFTLDGFTRAGVRIADTVVDLHVAAPHLPYHVKDIIAGGEAVLSAAWAAANDAPPGARHPLSAVKLAVPIPNPGKFVCVGLNYADHVAEAGINRPQFPGMFHRVNTSFVGPADNLLRPRVSDEFDFEGELLVVIGKRARHVSTQTALSYVAGYSIFNDGSVRDFQKQKALAAGKNFDASGAFGPEIVTPDELPAGARGLTLETRLNGLVVQQTNTDRMLFDVAEIISLLGQIHTLEPGDLISTGTCAGVGVARTPQLWMKPGDYVEVKIDGIGILGNSIVDETVEDIRN